MEKKTSPLEKLINKVKQGSSKYNFYSSIEAEEIENVEKALGVVLPNSYKKFIQRFNGGMILEHKVYYYTDMTDWEPDGPKYSSYYFYTLEEFQEKYSHLEYKSTMFSDDFEGIFPLLPICNTPKQETIMLVSQKGILKESPVFISSNIEDMSTYVQIADNFDSFLATIIEHDGFPTIITDERNTFLSIYLNDNNIDKIAKKKETNIETIERTTALISISPKDAWNYLERGNSYEGDGQRKLALHDYNTAIKLNDSEPFFYYCRGNLIYEYGSARKALIDLDTAVKLKPDDSLYLTGRAKCFLKLNILDKALDDCNKVLNIDGVYEIALATRCRVYGAMGEFEKADADSALLDDIYNR